MLKALVQVFRCWLNNLSQNFWPLHGRDIVFLVIKVEELLCLRSAARLREVIWCSCYDFSKCFYIRDRPFWSTFWFLSMRGYWKKAIKTKRGQKINREILISERWFGIITSELYLFKLRESFWCAIGLVLRFYRWNLVWCFSLQIILATGFTHLLVVMAFPAHRVISFIFPFSFVGCAFVCSFHLGEGILLSQGILDFFFILARQILFCLIGKSFQPLDIQRYNELLNLSSLSRESKVH